MGDGDPTDYDYLAQISWACESYTTNFGLVQKARSLVEDGEHDFVEHMTTKLIADLAKIDRLRRDRDHRAMLANIRTAQEEFRRQLIEKVVLPI